MSAAGFLQADTIINTIEKEGRAPINIPEIDRAQAGEPQTLMILGSDQRFGDKKLGIKPRSDTIILVRLDPDKEATAVMSVPRDLKVDIPGYGKDRDQRRLRARRPAPDGQDRQEAVRRRPASRSRSTTSSTSTSAASARSSTTSAASTSTSTATTSTTTSGGENFATIDVNPGYQKLKGQDALDYVRYRHGDNDLVRARAPAGLPAPAAQRRRRRASCSTTAAAASSRRSSPATPTPTRACGTRRTSSRCSSSSSSPAASRSARSASAIDLDAPIRVYLTASQNKLAQTADEFLNAKASKKPRQTSHATEADRKAAASRKKRNRAADRAGPRGRPARGRGPGDRRRAARADFPFYFPTLRYHGSRYAGTEPRIYGIRDERGKLHRAYRLVVSKGVIGEYYGIQGTTWRAPPILDDPSRDAQGQRPQARAALRRHAGCGWSPGGRNGPSTGSRTRSRSRSDTRQMIAIAASLRRLGQK